MTLLSKSLALLIFILMPFFGGYIGYKIGFNQASPEVVYINSNPKIAPEVTSVESVDVDAGDKSPVTETINALPDPIPEFVLKNSNRYKDTFPEQDVILNGKTLVTDLSCTVQTGNHIQESYLQAVEQVNGLRDVIADVSQVVGSVNCWFGGGGHELFMYKEKFTDKDVKVAGYETGECGNLPASECSGFGKVEILY